MLIDANIFLEALLDQKKAEACRIFLNKTVSGEINAFVSDFNIDSILLIMEENGLDYQRLSDFLKRLIDSKGITFYYVTMKDRFRALLHMKNHGFGYEDSLTLQSALSTKCNEIVSFDKHFDKVKEIKRVEP